MPTIIPVTTKAYFRTLSILHLALTTGQFLFALIALLLQVTGKSLAIALAPDTVLSLQYLALALSIAGIAGSHFLFRNKIQSLKNMPQSAAKYKGYRNACVLRYAVMEAPAMILVVLFIVCGSYIFLGLATLMILLFLWLRPSKAAMIQQLQIAYPEQQLLETDEAVLYEDEIVSR